MIVGTATGMASCGVDAAGSDQRQPSKACATGSVYEPSVLWIGLCSPANSMVF